MERTEKEEFIIGSISLLANKLNHIGDGILPDITFKQWFLLIIISKIEEDQRNINHISKFVGTSRQNIKKMLSSLENKHYVILNKSQQDARSLNVVLTEKSYQYFKDNDDSTANESNKLFSLFSNEEIIAFAKNLQKLMESMEQYSEGKSRNNEEE